jgi:integrase
MGVFDVAVAPGKTIDEWLKHGRLTLAQARLVAGHWKQERRAGRDPVADRGAAKAQEEAASKALAKAMEAEAQEPTVRQAIDIFAAKHLHGKKSANAMQYRLDRLAAILGDRKIREVTRAQMIAALEKIADGKREGKSAKQLAGEVLIQSKRLWRFAESREWVRESCIEPLSRMNFDAPPRKRETALHLEEVAELWRALSDPNRCKTDKVTIAALRVLILTGQREREVTDAQWSEFDLEAATWVIPAHRTKARRSHVVHLAPQTMAILAELRAKTGHGRYVFPSPLRPEQPIYGRSVCNALHLMFRRNVLSKATRCHVHDLRRTLITRLPDLDFEPFIGHKIANHVLPGVLATTTTSTCKSASERFTLGRIASRRKRTDQTWWFCIKRRHDARRLAVHAKRLTGNISAHTLALSKS